jgi:hypothetical protein
MTLVYYSYTYCFTVQYDITKPKWGTQGTLGTQVTSEI